MKYFVHTYGCQMNIHESEKIAGILEKIGYSCAENEENADLIAFNTCCIRETAEQKIFGHLGNVKKLKEENPQLIVLLCGCMTQQKNETEYIREKFPYVDIVLGSSNLDKLAEAVEEVRRGRGKVFDVEMTDASDLPTRRTSAPNAWVNIIYGCDNFCTYCIVPHVRGRERSRPMPEILAEVSSLLAQGYKEITLLGQNVNSYGKDLKDGTTFAALLDEIGKMKGKFRLRFLTSHPKDFTDDIIEVMAKHKNICNFIHLPVQSGSNEILRRMNRRYTREEYIALTDRIRAALPDVGITSDIMIGFPGETEEDFNDTLDLVRRVRFSTAFCFVYSRRKGTPAYSMDGQIPADVKKKRITTLLATQAVVTKEISKSMHGKTYEILVEDKNEKYENTYCGRTEDGRLVNFVYDGDPIGKFAKVKISTSRSATLWGTPEELEE